MARSPQKHHAQRGKLIACVLSEIQGGENQYRHNKKHRRFCSGDSKIDFQPRIHFSFLMVGSRKLKLNAVSYAAGNDYGVGDDSSRRVLSGLSFDFENQHVFQVSSFIDLRVHQHPI